MTLAQDLKKQLEQIVAKVPGEALEQMVADTQALAASGLAESSLKAGSKVPDFTLPNAEGSLIRFSDIYKQGSVVLSFYRGEWCPFCNLELKALQTQLSTIKKLGASLVAISPQTSERTLSTVQNNNLGFEVLSDQGNRVAKSFGLVHTLPENLRPIYQSLGIDIPAHNGDETFELPLAATYVVDPQGTIIHAFVNVDYTQRQEPGELINILEKTSSVHALI